ncbi:DegT/DnrJ/EryC1/StrS family aminotransferase [Thermodesulfobacteriota bacterium]
MKIPLIKPFINAETKAKVSEVLDSGYLTEGPVTKELEKAFKDYIGSQYAIAVSNCTVGLETALRSLGIGPGDEVIVPDYTYPATASVVNIVGAKIVLVDINKDSMLVDYDAVIKAINPNTKAVIPVSIFGNPLDYDKLDAIKNEHDLFIIEDAACSIGAVYNNKKVGNIADISVFSLHPRKFITTGEGGIITTNSIKWADWIESYKHFGMDSVSSRASTIFKQIGTNYKLSNIQAAVGLTQMKQIDILLKRRSEIADRYINKLMNIEGVILPVITSNGQSSYQSFCVFVENRDDMIRELRAKGIETQIGTYSLHMHPAFSDNSNCRTSGHLQNSRFAFDHCLTLPMYHDMTIAEQDYVVQQLAQFI